MSINQTGPVYFLLVDDLEENLLSLEALLRRDGLEILKAKSGKQALEMLLKYDIALALLDVQMPEMDGFELAELMRGTNRTSSVPIIFLTAGSANLQRRFRGYEAGAVDFLQKPIEPDILRSKAAVFFDLHRGKQQLAFQRDELKKHAEALKEADRRKDEFLATLAHELRNPLAPIRNGLQILRMSPSEEISDQTRDMIDRQFIHLIRLIDDLLDVSRVSQGKIDLRKENIKLQDALQSAIETSRPFIDSCHHSFTMDIPEEDIWLNADLIRISQIISNLLNNAAKYTAEGGKIHLGIKIEDQNIIINVSDNGLGIPQDMLSKIFELFTQVSHKLDRSKGGLGIGLALVKQLVGMHGGSISAVSEGVNKGSIFTVRLPLSTKNKESAPIIIPEKSPPLQKNNLKILVVDDNVDSAKTTSWALELIGHEPTMAHNGNDAIEAAKKLKPDVIMLDIGLPDINGYEVCKKLKADPLFKKTLLIAQTGWGQENDKLQAKEAGFDHHLVKPAKFEELSQLLSSIKID